MDIEELEEHDGVRFTFNMVPSTHKDAQECVVPYAAVYKPLADKPDLKVLNYEPVYCRNSKCRGILNPHAFMDYASKSWTCPLCFTHNAVPPNYNIFTADAPPEELKPENTTVEYILPRSAQTPPIFMFVVDTCQDEESFKALKDSLLVSLGLLPPNALVGLISYGKVVHVHQLGFDKLVKTIVFNGAKDYSKVKILENLGFLAKDLKLNTTNKLSPGALWTVSQYLLPVSQVEFQLTNSIEQLQANSFPVEHDMRPERCTGAAINIAIGLLEGMFPDTASRIMLFSAGPCTIGPGLIVGTSLKEPIRSHHDIDDEDKTAKHYKTACSYYEKLAKRATASGFTVDIFAGCYDQIGLGEMHYLSKTTGGVIVLTDSFTTAIFKQSFVRLFSLDGQGLLEFGSLGTLTVRTSKELKVAGLLGSACSLAVKDHNVAETEVGIGGTSQWKLCGFRPTTSYALFFDVVSRSMPMLMGNEDVPKAVIQFSTCYLHASGVYRLRVTTVGKPIFVGNDLAFKQGFDQEAAAAIIARLAIDKAENGMPVADIIRWVDGLLISTCARFAEYIKNMPNTFQLLPEFTYFPQFIYHLRRSQFLQVFNNSPDETIYYRHVFSQEDVTNNSIMIQPTLTAYEIDKEPEPVLLDTVSVTKDRVLLLDTFFHLLIYHGETIAAWRKAGYQDLPEYENFKTLLELPRQDAVELLSDRFPLPRFIDTEARGSQARFLFSRLNPSKSNTSDPYAGVNGEQILTDDVSLQDFMEYLIKLVVSGKDK